MVAREPPVRGARDRTDGQGEGARHRPRAPAHLAGAEADAVGPVAAGARAAQRGRRRRGQGDEGGHVRRLRRDPPGVEGLVHISELAQHHVENPREVVAQGDTVPVLILEVDAERRRLSLSLKRVDADRRAESESPIEGTPHLDLSEDVFSDSAASPAAPPLEEDASLESTAAAEDSVEREAVNAGDEVDPASADEVPAESAADDR